MVRTTRFVEHFVGQKTSARGQLRSQIPVTEFTLRRREADSDREDSQQPLSMLTFEVPLLTEHREPSILQEKNEMEVVGWTLLQLRNEVKIEIACFCAFGVYQ